MKRLFRICLLSLPLYAKVSEDNFRVLCHEQYTADMKSTLAQFSGFTKPAELKKYQDFILMANSMPISAIKSDILKISSLQKYGQNGERL